MPTARAQRSPAPETAQPILCECTAARHRRLGPHRNHRAELARNRTLGAIPDETAAKGPVAP